MDASMNRRPDRPDLSDVLSGALESLFTGIVNEYSTSSLSRPTAHVPTRTEPVRDDSVNTPQINSFPRAIDNPPSSRVYPRPTLRETIIDTIYDYNTVMYEYNRNMRHLIGIMAENSVHMEDRAPAHAPSSTPAPQHQDRVNAPNANEINAVLTYYLYPFTNATQNQEQSLTRDEISRVTQTYGYTEEMTAPTDDTNESSSRNTCPISMEDFQVGDVICEIVGCGHRFKRPSLMNWLRRSSHCPVCRYDLRTENP
jgi:hypothetical protein